MVGLGLESGFMLEISTVPHTVRVRARVRVRTSPATGLKEHSDKRRVV